MVWEGCSVPSPPRMGKHAMFLVYRDLWQVSGSCAFLVTELHVRVYETSPLQTDEEQYQVAHMAASGIGRTVI